MSLTDVVGAGRGVLELIAECARDIVRAVQQTIGPLLAGGQTQLPVPPRARPVAPPGQGPHEAVEATKFFGGTPTASSPVPATLPRAYGVNRAVLAPRDPCCLFVWWEITPVSRVEALRALGSEAEGAREVLRIHRGVYPSCRPVDDVLLTPGAERWYVEVEPGDTWTVEIGLRTPGGRFVSLVRSNPVESPPAEASADTTVRWVTVGRQGTTPAAPAWSGQWVSSEPADADLEPSTSRSSEALPFR